MKVNGQFQALYSDRFPRTPCTGGRNSLGNMEKRKSLPLTGIFFVCAVCERDMRTNVRGVQYEMDLSGSGWGLFTGR